MAVEGGLRCVKYLIFFFNFLFWLCSLGLIVLGILVQVYMHRSLHIQDASASGAPILIMAVGVVIFFITFFGCCGAWKENYCMITTFAVLLSLIIFVEIGAAVTGYIFRGKIGDVLEDSLIDMISNYNTSSQEFRETVDKLQEDLHCCGINNSSDWRGYGADNASVPDSCCKEQTTDCGKGAMTDASRVYQMGCHDVLAEGLRKNFLWVIVAALVIALLQVIGIVFACLLMRGIRKGYEVM